MISKKGRSETAARRGKRPPGEMTVVCEDQERFAEMAGLTAILRRFSIRSIAAIRLELVHQLEEADDGEIVPAKEAAVRQRAICRIVELLPRFSTEYLDKLAIRMDRRVHPAEAPVALRLVGEGGGT